MRHMSPLPILLASVVGAALASFVPTDQVPLLGPSFLSNFDPTDTAPIRDAVGAFPGVIDSLLESEALNKTDLVFAIDVFSAATNASIYSYFHVGESQNQTLTSGELTEQTVFRVGSVTKLFTVYAILEKAGYEVFSHPVTRYIPELASNSSGDVLGHVCWEDITVGALASQQAGSGGVAGLLVTSTNPVGITPQDLFNYMLEKHPVISPYRTAVYSDGGFAILAQILARLSGLSYADALRDILFKPLGLNSISTTAPNSSDISAVDRRAVAASSSFGLDVPIVAGTGGIYASAADLRITGLSILNSELLSAATTQHWMKPLSGTGSLVELVGAPWEIERLAIPVTPGSDKTRISDLYTKAGGTGDYTCIFALSPDHGIGFSILVAGTTASSARWVLREAVGKLFIPAAEAAAAENAKKNLEGVFVSSTYEGTNITFRVDEGQPGLGLESVYYQNVESSSVLSGAPINASLRLFPTGPNSYSRSLAALYKTGGSMKVAHRMLTGFLPLAPRAASEDGTGGLFDNQQSWMDLDFSSTLDEFIFTIEDGRLMSVENTGAQITFDRVN